MTNIDQLSTRDIALAAIAANRILINLLIENGVNKGRLTSQFHAKAQEMRETQNERNAAALLEAMGAA